MDSKDNGYACEDDYVEFKGEDSYFAGHIVVIFRKRLSDGRRLGPARCVVQNSEGLLLIKDLAKAVLMPEPSPYAEQFIDTVGDLRESALRLMGADPDDAGDIVCRLKNGTSIEEAAVCRRSFYMLLGEFAASMLNTTAVREVLKGLRENRNANKTY